MRHNIRISVARQTEIVDESIASFHKLRDHLTGCTTCNVANAIACPEGAELGVQVERAQKNLHRIGIESSVKF